MLANGDLGIEDEGRMVDAADCIESVDVTESDFGMDGNDCCWLMWTEGKGGTGGGGERDLENALARARKPELFVDVGGERGGDGFDSD